MSGLTKAIDITHHFVGYDGTAVITTWHDTKKEANAAVRAGLSEGAFFAKAFKGGCLGTYRVAKHFKSKSIQS